MRRDRTAADHKPAHCCETMKIGLYRFKNPKFVTAVVDGRVELMVVPLPQAEGILLPDSVDSETKIKSLPTERVMDPTSARSIVAALERLCPPENSYALLTRQP